jgi:signal transduction histidine kinase/ActR/RegA family two-component response regulator
VLPELVLARLVQHAGRLLALGSPVEILACSCREALELTGGTAVFGSYASPGQAWERGHHVMVAAGAVEAVPPAARSALFAVHRQLAVTRRPQTLDAGAASPAVMSALAPEPGPPVIHAVPILHRSGRVVGEITVGGASAASAAEVLAQLASLACGALDGAERLASARRAQDRLLLFAEATEEALWDWDIDSNDLWWGGGIQNLLGPGSIWVENKLSWKLARIAPEDVGRVEVSLRAALEATASAWREEYRFRRADGSWMVVDDRGYFLREADGRAYRAVGTMRDVTPLYGLLEREKQARAAAETASRAKDEFLAMLGHELRNPLAPIMTALQLLRLRGGDEIDTELTVLDRQAQHLVRLVDDLLDVSRVTRGKIELRREHIEMAEVVAKAIEMASPLIEERRHHLGVQVARRGLVVHGDPARLAQVVANLLTNAAKYTDHGGHIELLARRVDGAIELAVRDTGCGIAADMLPHVFDMFVQERQALDRGQGGLGLGLCIVRSLVALHGGAVNAHSDGRGRGSTFTVRLPASERAEPSLAPPEDAAARALPSRDGHRILVVDDNEDAAILLATCLEQLGNTAAVAHDGPAALRLADEFDPEVVLLDLGLPVMDGYQVARALRGRERGPRPHLVAVTGYGTEVDRARTREAGFDGHLVKPVSIDQLRQVMSEAARRRVRSAPLSA